MSDKEDDSTYLCGRLEAYMDFVENEIKAALTYPIVKRKKFLESFLIFYEEYLEVRSRIKNANDVFPKTLHDKIMSNLQKIKKLAYEKDDYIYEIRTNLDVFEMGLTEIFYVAYNDSKEVQGVELEEDIKKTLAKKSMAFLKDLDKSIEQYEKDYKEPIPKDVIEKMLQIKKSLRKDFGIIVDEDENIGPISITFIDSDMILDMYEKIKKMRKGKKKEAEETKLARMYEIYNK